MIRRTFLLAALLLALFCGSCSTMQRASIEVDRMRPLLQLVAAQLLRSGAIEPEQLQLILQAFDALFPPPGGAAPAAPPASPPAPKPAG